MADQEVVYEQPPMLQVPVPSSQPYDRGFMHIQLLDSDPNLTKIRCMLLGITEDGKGSYIRVQPRLLKIEDINKIMTILSLYSSKNIPLANFTKEEVNKKCYEFCCDIIEFFAHNYIGKEEVVDYETRDGQTHKVIIKIDSRYLGLLVDTLDDTVHSFLTRARDNEERRMIVKTTTEGAQRVVHEQPQQPGGWLRKVF